MCEGPFLYRTEGWESTEVGSRKEGFNKWFESEKQKMSTMTAGQKASYIITYYWLWILGIVCTVFLICYIASHALFSVKDYWFYGMFVNTMEDGSNGSALRQDFVVWGGYDTSEKKVEFNARSYFDPTVSGGTNNSYYQAFVALVESGDLDVAVMGEKALQGIGSSGRLRDLRDEDCADIMEKYGDRLVYCIPYDEEYSTDAVPVGIDISDSLLTKKYGLYEDDCVLGIAAYSKRIDSVEMFLEFLYSGDEEGEGAAWEE